MRLTNSMRGNIVAKVLKFKFEAQQKALDKEGHKLFDEVCDLLLGKHKKTVEALPADWFPLAQTLCVSIDDVMYTLSGSHPRRLPGSLPRTFDAARHRTRSERSWSWQTDHGGEYKAVFALLEPHVRKLIALSDERKTLEAKLNALVHSVTTDTKLYELWPELTEIVPMVEPTTAKGTALTVSIKELNELIPLPSKKEAACSTSSTKTARRGARKTSASGAKPSKARAG